ncbi:MAG: hypothetical protein ACEQR8_02155 [Cypionkella sp.]
MLRTAAALALAVPLAACGPEPDREPPPPRDPQVAAALDDPLMTDPDLSARNEAAAALTVEIDSALPSIVETPEETARAEAEAAALVGGADRLVPLGDPGSAGTVLARGADASERVRALAGSRPCEATLAPSPIWAARMPRAFPVYPRGNMIDAAGSDTPGCRVRTVAFATPVAREKVLAFYAARARSVGADDPSLAEAGRDWRLRGRAGRLAYDIYAREDNGTTLVRLTTIER